MMAINTTSLRRHWPKLAREKDITHWACTDVRMLKEDQLWFSARYTKEDKINVTWEPPMDRREDGQPEFGGTCVITKQRAFSIPFESSDCHETLRWLLTTKRFLMVKIPIGNGSKNATLMVVCAHPGRGKEANAWNEHIFDAVVGFAAGLGDTPLMICGDCSTNREGSRGTSTSRSAKAGSRTWDRRTNVLEQLNPCTPTSKGIQKRAWTLHWSTRPSARQWETSGWCSETLCPSTKGSRSL